MPYARDYFSPELLDRIPTNWTQEQKLIKASKVAAGWLECSAMSDDYPVELRSAWRQHGIEWLNLAMKFTGPGLEFTRDANVSALDRFLELANDGFDVTKELDPYDDFQHQ